MRRLMPLGWTFALLAALGAAPSAAAERSFGSRFVLSLGGFTLAELTFDGTLAAQGYRAEARLATAGLVDSLYRAGFTARAGGRRAGAVIVPQHFEARTFDSDNSQDLAIRYAAGRPQAVTAVPPFKKKPWQIDPRAQAGTLDPVSAAVALFAPQPEERLCARMVETFDGRKRARLSFGTPERRGARIRCAGQYERLAGFKPERMEEPSVPLTVWYARGPGGYWHLDRASAPTSYGTAVLKRRTGAD